MSFESEVPDPLAEDTFRRSVLRWEEADSDWLEHYRQLLDLRRKHIAPRKLGPGRYRMLGKRAFEVTWDGLRLIANCSDSKISVEKIGEKPLWSNGNPGEPWTVCWWTRE